MFIYISLWILSLTNFFSIRILDFVIFIVKFSLFIREINLLSVIYFLQVHPFTFDYVFILRKFIHLLLIDSKFWVIVKKFFQLWPPDVKNWLIGKDPDAGKDWRQEKKGTTEYEMVGWHHWLNGHESDWTLGAGDGQGGLQEVLQSMGSQSQTWLSDWTGLNWGLSETSLSFWKTT